MDVLSDVLQAVRLKGAMFFDVRAAEPLIAHSPNMADVGQSLMPGAGQVIPFHILLRGKCWIETTEGDLDPRPEEIGEGDMVFYPHGHAHVFVTNPGDRTGPRLEIYRRPNGEALPILLDSSGNGPQDFRFACGYLACDTGPFNPLLESLPPRVLARRPREGNHIEVDLIHTAVAESESGSPGSEAVLARLSELLFVRVMRRYIDQLPEQSKGWLAGLRDPNVSKALQLIHGSPAHDWTLDELARQSGMSRASFADRFVKCVGETPMRYLTKWRMQRAAQTLKQPGATIEMVAEQVGYQSEAAFNRAFKSVVGMPPGAWRRSATP